MALGSRFLGAAFVLGAGALAIAAVVAAPHVLRTARPLVREGLKRGIKFYEGARASVAEFAEDIEDLVAEVKTDLTAEPSAAVVNEEPRVAP